MKIINNFLQESPKINDLESVLHIVSTFTDQEKKWTGCRNFYKNSDFRKVLYINNKPVAFIEAMIYKKVLAKINLGIIKSYRGSGLMNKLFKESEPQLKKMGIHTLIASVEKENIPSQKFLPKVGMKQITNNIEEFRKKYNMMPSSDFFYYIKRI